MNQTFGRSEVFSLGLAEASEALLKLSDHQARELLLAGLLACLVQLNDRVSRVRVDHALQTNKSLALLIENRERFLVSWASVDRWNFDLRLLLDG